MKRITPEVDGKKKNPWKKHRKTELLDFETSSDEESNDNITTIRSPQSISNITKLFNNKTHSDCVVHFKKSGTNLHLHKLILRTNSDFFNLCFSSGMQEAQTNIVEIEEEDKEELMTQLLKNMYGSEIAINNEKIVPMLLLSEKYQVSALTPILIKHLSKHINETNAIQCIELNLDDKRYQKIKERATEELQNNSKKVLNSLNYLHFSEGLFEQVLNLAANDTNVKECLDAVHRWVEEDEENRIQVTYKLTGMVRTLSNVHFTELVGFVYFDPAYCGNKGVLSKNNQRITKHGSDSSWNLAALGTRCSKFKIRLISTCKNLMIGMAPQNINKNGSNYTSCGWYFSCNNGLLYSQGGHSASKYSGIAANTDGTIIGVKLTNGNISFSVNDQDLGVAFRNVTGKVFPAFNIYDPNCEFEFVNE